MKLIRPFSAAIFAFRANLPIFTTEGSRIQKYLNVQAGQIERGCSFDLKELKDYEHLIVRDRPHNLSEEKALEFIVANQGAQAHHSRTLFLKSHIPGYVCFFTFAWTEMMMRLSFDSVPDTIAYTGVPALAFSIASQYIIRYSSYDTEYKKWRMAMRLQELFLDAKKQNEVTLEKNNVILKQ